MRYACLIYHNEKTAPAPNSQAGGELMQGYMAFDQDVAKSGVKLGGEALHPTSSATSGSIEVRPVVVFEAPPRP